VQSRGRDWAYTSGFGEGSPFVAEGHTRAGMRGLVLTVLDPWSYEDNRYVFSRMDGYGDLGFASTSTAGTSSPARALLDLVPAREIKAKATQRHGHVAARQADPPVPGPDREVRRDPDGDARVYVHGQTLLLAFHCPKNGKLLPFSNRPLDVRFTNPGANGAGLEFVERASGRCSRAWRARSRPSSATRLPRR